MAGDAPVADPAAPQPAAPQPTAPQPAANRIGAGGVVRAAVVVLAIALVWVISTSWSRWASTDPTTDDAYLQTDLTPLSSKVAGYVRIAPPDDYHRVRTGETVVQLRDDDYRAAAAQAEAAVTQAQAAIGTIDAQAKLQSATIRAAAAGVSAARAIAARNASEARRQLVLEQIGSGTAQTSELSTATSAQSNAQLQQAAAQRDAAQAQLGVLAAQRVQALATLRAQEAALAVARLNLSYTRITAPADGTLGQRLVRQGQYLNAGQQVAQFAPLPRLWVLANFKETQLRNARIGDAVEFRVDAFPGARLRGHIVAIAPTTGSQAALLPPDNATGNFTKVVQRLGVKVAIDDAAGLGERLRAGMSVVARIRTGAQRNG